MGDPLDRDLSRALDKAFGTPAAALAMAAHRRALAGHGDTPRWLAALAGLPVTRRGWLISDGRLHAGAPADNGDRLRALLETFIPWRKGPLVLGGVAVDTEWRSDWKWQRVAGHLDLAGARVLDVGAGNGYFGWCMLAAGAREVIGCDPGVGYVMQHAAIRHFAGPAPHHLLALRLEELPAAMTAFDGVFSMGVLYHRRDHLAHLRALRERLVDDGQLVLETLIIPGEHREVLVPAGRYAGMRNVHALPTLMQLEAWLAEGGFDRIACVDVSVTTSDEQRATAWMPFHSLSRALADADTTVEGHPRPRRAMMLARAA